MAQSSSARSATRTSASCVGLDSLNGGAATARLAEQQMPVPAARPANPGIRLAGGLTDACASVLRTTPEPTCFSDLAQECISLRAPVRKVIVPIRSPRRDHRKHEEPAVAKQEWIGCCVVIANLVGCVGDVELDWPVATRLEVNEPHPAGSSQQVAGVRF